MTTTAPINLDQNTSNRAVSWLPFVSTPNKAENILIYRWESGSSTIKHRFRYRNLEKAQEHIGLSISGTSLPSAISVCQTEREIKL